jgi:hypothetical protein
MCQGCRFPTWEEVENRAYETWARPHLVVDTAGQRIEQSTGVLRRALKLEG